MGPWRQSSADLVREVRYETRKREGSETGPGPWSVSIAEVPYTEDMRIPLPVKEGLTRRGTSDLASSGLWTDSGSPTVRRCCTDAVACSRRTSKSSAKGPEGSHPEDPEAAPRGRARLPTFNEGSPPRIAPYRDPQIQIPRSRSRPGEINPPYFTEHVPREQKRKQTGGRTIVATGTRPGSWSQHRRPLKESQRDDPRTGVGLAVAKTERSRQKPGRKTV